MDFLSRDTTKVDKTTGELIESIGNKVSDLSTLTMAGQAVVAIESASDVQKNAVISTRNSIMAALESIRVGVNGPSMMEGVTEAQKDAAAQAGMLAANWQKARTMSLSTGAPRDVGQGRMISIEAFGVGDVVDKRSFAMESYNEQDNRSAVAYSITYNMQSARQDDFGETFYPTLTIPADQAGVTITTNLLFVMDNVDRDVSGAAYDLKRKNVLRAVADPTVLRKEQTRAVPVYRTQSEANFVDDAVLATRTVDIDGTPIVTSALLFGKTVDLLGISQSDAMISLGVQNQTDTLDPTVDLSRVYVSIATNQILGFTTLNLPYFNFVPNAQGDYKLLSLTADTTSFLINKDTTHVDGTALSGALAVIATNNLIVRIHAVYNGSVRTDTGNITVYANTFEVAQIVDADTGENIALTDPSVTAMVAAINAAVQLGYDVQAYRSNANRRQQGQFVDVAKEFQRYLVPLRSPITARHPAHIDGQVDASDVQALITATRIRVSNESITATLQSLDLLSQFVDARDPTGEAPDVLGVGRYYVRPQFISRDFDATLEVDSLRSYERAADISAALINHIRDIAYLLYRDSEYKAASDAIYGGQGPLPTVIVGTDPYTARYINLTGDLRTLGGEFNVVVVSSLDIRMRGKIVIGFGIFDADRNSSVNPLNNGNLLWAPELVLTANIGRQGQYSRETLVQPRYRFIQNLPVMGVIQVSNIPNVLNKLPLFVNDTTPTP